MVFILSRVGKMSRRKEQVFPDLSDYKTGLEIWLCPELKTLGQSGKPSVFFISRFPFILSATFQIPAKFKPQWFGILTVVLRITMQNESLKIFLKTKH